MSEIDLDRLLQLRLVVARFGEMDIAKWWNTTGQLGRWGTGALRRGFPRTHSFAQARSVFAVAAHRCAERFDAPDAVTLWRLPAALDEDFDARWEHWLDAAAGWRPFFEKIAALESSNLDLIETLRGFGLVSGQDVAACQKLRSAFEGRAVPLPNAFSGSAEDIALLALGFARGTIGSLAVPWAPRARKEAA
jgi:hypothetical protein